LDVLGRVAAERDTRGKSLPWLRLWLVGGGRLAFLVEPVVVAPNGPGSTAAEGATVCCVVVAVGTLKVIGGDAGPVRVIAASPSTNAETQGGPDSNDNDDDGYQGE